MNAVAGRRRALFLDRDGTLMVDTGYVRDPADVSLLPGVGAALRTASELGFLLVLVSNQSGVARGIISSSQLEAVQTRFEGDLADVDVKLDDVRFCLHGPNDGCRCRKPAAGMLVDAAAHLGIDLTSSVILGDRASDMLAGQLVGVGTRILLDSTTADPLASLDRPGSTNVIADLTGLAPILRGLR